MNTPALLYHHTNWIDKDPTLNVTPDVFERQMQLLVRNGYRTVFLDDLLKMAEKGESSKNVVAVTFDDGYLDNWVYAYPILKKYGLKATIFITTGNVKDSDEVRPSAEDAWSRKISEKDLPPIDTHFNVNFDCTPGQPNVRCGFMSWGELRSMQASGLIDIQSHSHTHGYYYVNDNIVGFNRMQSWAVSWPTDGDARFGIPLYERGPSLVARRYRDDLRLRNAVADFAQTLASSLLRRLSPAIWQKKLHRKAEALLSSNKPHSYYETQIEYAERVIRELSTSKREIENRINKPCDYLSFPAGKYNAMVIDSLKEVGYKAAFANTPYRGSNDTSKYALPRSIILGNFKWFVNYLNRPTTQGKR